MPLSVRQQAALKVVLHLAGGAVPPVPVPGATISQQAGAAAHPAGAGAPGAPPAGAGSGGAGHKVATSQGAAHYHLPIGSLIIPHPNVPGKGGGTRFVKGADPGGGHMVRGYISQAKWIANEWKKHPHVMAAAAHQAVEAGTHHWVKAGEHQFAVHKGVEIHVPNHTDLGDPAKVAAAPKLFIHHGENGSERLAAHPSNLGEPHPHTPNDAAALSQGWKQLHHAETPQKSVAFAGKHAAWVPSDWQVHKNTVEPDESKHKVKFAKAPDGTWHYIYQNGTVKPVPHGKTEGWAKSGVITPDEPHAGEHAEHEDHGLPPVAPEQEDKPAPSKVDVGGVAVTKAEIKDAIAKLTSSKSTQIKGLLKGNPLFASDYGSVYKAELKKYPHLQVPPGTKKAHVPEAKNAFIHALTDHLVTMSDDDASEEVAKAVREKTEAQAEHAQHLTPHEITLPKDTGEVDSAEELEQEAEEEPAPEPDGESVKVEYRGKTYPYPAGTKVYQDIKGPDTGFKYVKTPDGEWHTFNKYAAPGSTAKYSSTFDTMLGDGIFHEYQEPAAPAPEPAADAETTVTGITVNKDDIQAAIEALNAAKSTAIKQILKAKGNKLQNADYWRVIHAWEAAHPNTSKGKGTKQQHVGNAKQMFTAALQEKLDGLAKADQLTGHDDAAELHDLVKNGSVKNGAVGQLDGSLALAASKAVANDHNYHVYQLGSTWGVTVSKPSGDPEYLVYYKLTPELKLSVVSKYHPDGKPEDEDVLSDAVHKWIAPKPEEGGEPPPPAPEVPELSEALSAFKAQMEASKAWKASRSWQKLDATIKAAAANPDVVYPIDSTNEIKQKMAALLVKTSIDQNIRYLVKTSPGVHEVWTIPPQPGTFAAGSTHSWWEVRPDHQVIYHDTDGHSKNLPMASVRGYMAEGLKLDNKVLDSPKPESVTMGEHVHELKPGDAVFKSGTYAYYIHHADGTWTVVDKWDGADSVPETEHKTLLDWAVGAGGVKMQPHNDAAKVFADSLKDKPEPKGPPGKDVQIYVHGKKVGSLPAGTKVYVPSVSTPSVKYAKSPDGKWHMVLGSGVSLAAGDAQHSWDKLVAGNAGYPEEEYGEDGEPKKESKAPEPAAPEEPPEEEAPETASVPAIYQGQIVGEWPAGSKFYHKTVGSYQGTYAKSPDGKWHFVHNYGVSPAGAYKVTDAMLKDGTLEPEEPPSAEDIASAKAATEIKNLVKTGSVDPAKGTGPNHSVFKTWQAAALSQMAAKKELGYNSDVTVLPHEKGGFHVGYTYNSNEEHWTLSNKNWTANHWAGDGSGPVPVPMTQVLEAAKRVIVPDSVVVEGKLHKFGFWKKPKSSAYIEIQASQGSSNFYKYGSATHATYIYHATNGSTKEVTPAFAAKQLAGAEHLASEPKPAEVAKEVTSVTHATLASPGSYGVFSATHDGMHPTDSLELKPDGSAVLNEDDAVAEATVSAMVKGGMVLDKYGTTVVRPGAPVSHYHLFGGAPKTREDLEGFRKYLEDNWTEVTSAWTDEFSNLMHDDEHQGAKFVSYKHKDLVKAFIGDKLTGDVGGTAQRDAIYQLVKELLAVPELPEGAKVGVSAAGSGPKEVAYLKTLPPGIKTSADVFDFTQDGWAKPYKGALGTGFDSMSVPELKNVIVMVSHQFGDGKVVGTHLTMPKYQLVNWLNSWKKGDMQAVFAVDSEAGKVSPAHPGAPDNVLTHNITWSPLDSLQVPASQDVPGPWTELHYVAPDKELDNYLLAMHFQHGEYLQSYEKKNLVNAHRSHDQDTVDKYTGTVNQRITSGQAPYTVPLEHTPGLKPAKPYDSFLQNQQATSVWTTDALKAFVADHQANLGPYAQVAADEYGITAEQVLSPTASYYVHAKAVQAWLDDAHAKEIAQQMVPVWKKVDTGQLPSHGHTVWKAVQEVPYTGDKSTWFVKPAPDGKKFRLEQEHAANLLGKLFGFRTAESHILEDEPAFGQMVQVQKAVPGEPLGQYTDMPAWDSFTPVQVADMAMEHALDAVLFNDDTSANNMIKTPDGHLVGIDKGRAWGNMDWKSTAGNKDMNSMTQLVYTQLYDAIRKGQVSKDVADQAYTAVIQKVRKMASVPDASVRKLLEEGFAHRTKLPEGGKEALIQRVLDKKNSLEHDFHKMWSKVYQEAGFGAQSGDFGEGMPWGETAAANARWGAVVFNEHGQVLLREAKNHFGGAGWTFAKGGANPGETPMQAAVREGAEETKYQFTPVGYVPGAFGGKTSTNYYYLSTAKGAKFTPEQDNGETEQTRWVSVEEAKELIASVSEGKVAARDLAILQAAVEQWGDGEGLFHAQPLAEAAGLGSPMPLVPQSKLPAAPGGHTLFAGFSEPGFLDHVEGSKSHGTPAFFGGPDFRDMHVLVWQNKNVTGEKVTHGETFLKGSGYDKALAWLQKQAGKDAAPGWDDKETVYTKDAMPGQANDGSPDRGGVSKEKSYYNSIIKAARTVTRHKSDGQYNADVLENMESVAGELEKLMQGADAILSSPNGGGSGKEFAKNAKEMSTYYLDLIGQVKKAKEGSYGFAAGQLPRWLPTTSEPDEDAKSELEKLGYKVTYGHSSPQKMGKLSDDHEFQESGSGGSSDPGKWYHVALPSGETIEVGNGESSGVALVHHGRVRFTTTDHSAASLERVRDALNLMGLDAKEAEHRDFETFYWRHLLSIMDDRHDGHSGEQQKVWDELKNQFGSHGLTWTHGDGNGKHGAIIKQLQQLGETDPEAETDMYRHAFAKLTSEEQVQDWADRGGFLPHLKHFDTSNAKQVGGKPDWYRFDLAAKVKNLPMPIRQSTHADKVAEQTIKSGGTYGRDALLRVNGVASSGMSNPYNSGGPSYVFTRVNVNSKHNMWTPLALARTHNYAFSDDSFGEWKQRKGGSSWNPGVWSKYNGGSNEHMIMDAMSVLDDLELIDAHTEQQRQELIKHLKDQGVTHIRFMPVEDRIVKGIKDSDVAKVKANWAAHPELLDPLAEPYAHVGAEGEGTPQQASALDTTASAAAADEGSKPPADDPHVKFIVDSMTSQGHAPAEIWQPSKNLDIYYAKMPSGAWYSYDIYDDGNGVTGPNPESAEMAKVLNEDAHNQLVQVFGSPPAKPVSVPEMLDKINALHDAGTAGAVDLGEPDEEALSELFDGSPATSRWKAQPGGAWALGKHYKVVQTSGGFSVYYSTDGDWDNPDYLLKSDTLEDAQHEAAVHAGLEPPF